MSIKRAPTYSFVQFHVISTMTFLDAPVPKFFLSLPYLWRGVVIFGATLYIVIITLVTIAGAGYEYTPKTDTSFNKTIPRWYDVFVPHKLSKFAPDTWKCDPSVIKVGEGCSPYFYSFIKGIVTNSTELFTYILSGFYDGNPGDPVDGMHYENYLLQNCSVTSIQLQLPQDLILQLNIQVDLLERIDL
jgi:hypothetical protein